MAGNINRDLLTNRTTTQNNKPDSDINQNFVGEQKLFQNNMIRGLNSNKPSPDSGWTFPGLIAPQLFPCMLPFANSFTGTNIHKTLPDIANMTADFRNGVTNRDMNLYPPSPYSSENFQNKTLTPLMELNLRQQHQMFENAMITQSPAAGYSFLNFKTYDNGTGFTPSFNLPIGPMTFKPQLNNDFFTKGLQTSGFTNNVVEKPVWSNITANVNSISTPGGEGKRFYDSFMHSQTNLQSGSNGTDGSTSVIPAALLAAQMNNYVTLMKQNNLKLSHDLTIPGSTTSLKSRTPTAQNLLNTTKYTNNNPCSPQKHLRVEENVKTMPPDQEEKTFTTSGTFNSTDPLTSPSSQPTYGVDSRIYQASTINVVPVTSYAVDSQADVNRLGKESHPPQRPNHIGSGFIPQTQFLTVNVAHGTSHSDKDSSQSSPNHPSPYSSSSHQSRTPSPRSDQKSRYDNTCFHCGKQFSSSSALAKHKLIHSDERRYVCHICSRGFKRQDHLNGHMVTHREKKPYECYYTECGKSYCDMRSLRRHLENHHGSPPSGETPGGYMPKLVSSHPGFEESKTSDYSRMTFEHSVNRLEVSHETPRPSSAPLGGTPEPKRVTRTRRSSSGEESGVQLDTAMLRELEMRRANAYPAVVSEEYKAHQNDRLLLKTTTSGAPRAVSPYDSRVEYSRKLAEFEREHQQRHFESKRAAFERLHGNQEHNDLRTPERHYKDFESVSHKKHEFSPKGLPPSSYSHSSSSIPQPRYPSSQHYPPPGLPPGSAGMPFLINIRNPLGFPPHGSYYPHQSETPAGEQSKLSKTELDARQQAMNTYFQMLVNGQHGSLTPEQLFMYHSRFFPGSNAPTPTDATAIAIATAKERHERPVYFGRESLYGISPTNAQWQPVIQDDSKDTREKDISKLSRYYNSTLITSSANSDQSCRYPVVTTERNIIDEPFKPSESNHYHRYGKSPQTHFYDRNRSAEMGHIGLSEETVDYPPYPQERSNIFDGLTHKIHPLEPPKHLEVSPAINRFDVHHRKSQHRDTPKVLEQPLLRVEEANSSPAPLSPNKKRPRPGPIIIPAAVNNRSSTSPHKIFPRGIYTPPAMLSPRSVFFNPPSVVQRNPVPNTPGRLFLNVRRSTSVDQRETPLGKASVSSDELQIADPPEPKINVGPRFQAVLPSKLDRSEAQKDIHRASLMWSPLKEDEQKEDEVNAYLDMACSLALYGGSNNKEYALHILQRTRGNVKEAVRLLLSRRHILRADDPNADYHYSGSVRWTAKERLAFRQAYRQKGKIFIEIQKEVITKSLQLCVEFYYLWKAMHPESFRARTRMVEVESEVDDEEIPPTPTAAVAPLSTLREPVFECDYPECRARFVSRQALNGHIRVHGGSMSKPNEFRRSKTKPIVSPDTGDILPSPQKKKRQATPSSVIVTNEGSQLQFQCKVCGRVFSKVKSRSAHMKTHVKRDDNNKPIKQSKQQKEIYLQQQREHFLQQQRQLQQQQQQQETEHSAHPLNPVYAH